MTRKEKAEAHLTALKAWLKIGGPRTLFLTGTIKSLAFMACAVYAMQIGHGGVAVAFVIAAMMAV